MTLTDILIQDMSAAEALLAARARMQAHFAEHGGSPRKVAAVLQAQYPGIVDRVVAKADEAMGNMFMLPGTDGKLHFVGDPPDWNANPFHDNEYVWGLSRMEFLVPLLAAYLYTGQEAYCQKTIGFMENFIDTVPRPSLETLKTEGSGGLPVSGWRTLEIGIRMFNAWAFSMRALILEDKLTPAQFEKLLISIYEHGEALAEVTPVYWPEADHNHYLMENAGLLTLSLYYPELTKAQAWRKQAMHELERCAAAQLTVDGGQIEGCPGYHNGCMYWFYIPVARTRAFGLSMSDAYMDRLHLAFGYLLHGHLPDGNIAMWGDSTLSDHGLFGAMLCQLLYGDARAAAILEAYAGKAAMDDMLQNQGWWIDSEHDIARLLAPRPATAAAPPLYTVQRGLDQFIARSGWDRDAAFLFFACRLPVNNAHAHIDTAGFEYAVYGERLVIDPGVFCYRDDEQRAKYKSAQWHSTLLVNGRQPFDFISSWSFTPQKEGRITHAGRKEGVHFAEGIHTSYEPAIHSRFIALVGAEALIVLDRVDNLAAEDSVTMYVHLDSTEATPVRDNVFESVHGEVVMISAFLNASGEVLQGTISERMDIERPSKRLRLTGEGTDATRVFASVFVPKKGQIAPTVTIDSCSYMPDHVSVAVDVDGKLLQLDIDLSAAEYNV